LQWKHVAVKFGDETIRSCARAMKLESRCGEGLTDFYQVAYSGCLDLRSPNDDTLIVSVSVIDALPFDIDNPRMLPTRVEEDATPIVERLQKAAALYLLGKHLPSGAEYHKALRAVAGILLRDETSVSATEAILVLLARIADDGRAEWLGKTIARECKQRLDAGEAVSGIPTLSEMVGKKVTDAFLQWMALTPVPQAESVVSSLDVLCAKMLTNDMGNAQRLVTRHGTNVRYCHQWKNWMVWTGECWARDDTGQAMRLARETVRAIYNEANSLPVKLGSDGKDANRMQRDQLAGHAHRSGAHARLEALLKQAQSFEEVSVTAAQFDANPWLLNVLNGTVDLRTGQITAHRREDLQTKQVAVVFDPDAKCANWHKFLNRVLPDPEMREYVQRLVGYTLAGVASMQCLAFLYGKGRNGKSVFVNILEALMGDYWFKLRAEALMLHKQAGAINNDVAALVGRRLVTVSEIGEGEFLNEALVKDLTGNDTITARFLYGEFFTFQPMFTPWLYGNHKPIIRGTDEGIWRRMRLIPFLVTIPEHEVDPELPDKLRAELSGILNWALEGCRQWQLEGVTVPLAVREATKEYREESDVLKQFLDMCCDTEGAELKVSSSDLYAEYKTWCAENGERAMSQARLGKRLKERGFQPDRNARSRGWMGLRLLTDAERNDKDQQEYGGSFKDNLTSNPLTCSIAEIAPVDEPKSLMNW
jgi:P4 family phage/plasmid primase-like protien